MSNFSNDAKQASQTYGCWPSPLSASSVFEQSSNINFLRPSGHGVFYIDTAAGEKHCQALMHLSRDGKCTRISPPGVNVMSRVHEYGGLPYCFVASDANSGQDAVYYCNLSDNTLVRQIIDWRAINAGDSATAAPGSAALASNDTSGALVKDTNDGKLRYADFFYDSRFRRLLCVREDHRQEDGSASDPHNVVNALVAIDVNSGEQTVLFRDSDFVSSPRLSADGRVAAWIAWSHPNMPWDNTRLWVADVGDSGELDNLREIARDGGGSLLQPMFDEQGHLYFIADWTDWWNLYRVSADELNGDCRADPICPLHAEFASPPWPLGQRNYALPGNGRVIASYNRDCFWHLVLIDATRKAPVELAAGFGQLENLVYRRDEIFFSGATPSEQNTLFRLDPGGKLDREASIQRLRAEPGADHVDKRQSLHENRISRPAPIRYRTGSGENSPEHDAWAHGLFYAPLNPDFSAPPGTLPPLLVSIHGGPTSNAKTSLNLNIQYWTSRGFAVLDVNHRGSTGYGRTFRRSLYGQWGVYDIDDVLHGVDHLIREGRIDPDRIAIRGGSAGGYAVMAALASSSLFAVGCSYYGVSDFEMLARDTHKFESRYLDQLLGPYPEARQIYIERSPIHRIDEIAAPLLLLQGEDDKVVPPNQSQAIYDKLREKSVDVRYVLFKGEGHGFRQLENQVEALETELEFYRSSLGLTAKSHRTPP